MALRSLDVSDTRVSDLSPLQGMPLLYLNIRNSGVSDLRPLAGTAIRELDCRGVDIDQAWVLRRLRLQAIWVDDPRDKAVRILEQIPTLTTVNGQPWPRWP
jgi:hypothetical protein